MRCIHLFLIPANISFQNSPSKLALSKGAIQITNDISHDNFVIPKPLYPNLTHPFDDIISYAYPHIKPIKSGITNTYCDHKGKVFNIGTFKTGTTSTSELLERLGYYCLRTAPQYGKNNETMYVTCRFQYFGINGYSKNKFEKKIKK